MCLLFDLLYLGFLVDHYLVQLLEEQCQLAQCLLDALNVVVTRAHGAKNTRCLAGSVGFKLCNVLVVRFMDLNGHCQTYCLLENAFIAPVRT